MKHHLPSIVGAHGIAVYRLENAGDTVGIYIAHYGDWSLALRAMRSVQAESIHIQPPTRQYEPRFHIVGYGGVILDSASDRIEAEVRLRGWTMWHRDAHIVEVE